MIVPDYFRFWAAPLMTVVLETIFFVLAGFRRKDFLLLCAAVNIATNLALNLIAGQIGWYSVFEWWIILAELCVAGLEYLAYALALGRAKKLFLLTLAANALSFLAGVLLFGSF